MKKKQIINENELVGLNAVQLLEKYGGLFGTNINFVPLERHGTILRHVASQLNDLMWARDGFSDILRQVNGFCGLPSGGYYLAAQLAQVESEDGEVFGFESIFVENFGSGQYLAFDRHQPKSGEKWIVVDDVLRDDKRISQIINRMEGYGAEAVAVLCFCNSTGQNNSTFGRHSIPILSLMTSWERTMTPAPELESKPNYS